MTASELRHHHWLGSSWTDLLMVIACCMAFAAIVSLAQRPAPRHPIGNIAPEFGAPPELFMHVAWLEPLGE